MLLKEQSQRLKTTFMQILTLKSYEDSKKKRKLKEEKN
jgi:hypothetical protein